MNVVSAVAGSNCSFFVAYMAENTRNVALDCHRHLGLLRQLESSARYALYEQTDTDSVGGKIFYFVSVYKIILSFCFTVTTSHFKWIPIGNQGELVSV